MRAALQAGLLGCVIVALTGCSPMVGTWQIDSVQPPQAEGSFQFAKITFKNNNMYTADVKYHGQMEESTGKYKYNGMTKELTFMPEDHDQRTYKAELMADKQKMAVWQEGDDWKAILVKCCEATECDPAKCQGKKPKKSGKHHNDEMGKH